MSRGFLSRLDYLTGLQLDDVLMGGVVAEDPSEHFFDSSRVRDLTPDERRSVRSGFARELRTVVKQCFRGTGVEIVLSTLAGSSRGSMWCSECGHLGWHPKHGVKRHAMIRHGVKVYAQHNP